MTRIFLGMLASQSRDSNDVSRPFLQRGRTIQEQLRPHFPSLSDCKFFAAENFSQFPFQEEANATLGHRFKNLFAWIFARILAADSCRGRVLLHASAALT